MSACGMCPARNANLGLLLTVRTAVGVRASRCVHRSGVFIHVSVGRGTATCTQTTRVMRDPDVVGEADWEGETLLLPITSMPPPMLTITWCCGHNKDNASSRCPGVFGSASIDLGEHVQKRTYVRQAVRLEPPRASETSVERTLYLGMRVVVIGPSGALDEFLAKSCKEIPTSGKILRAAIVSPSGHVGAPLSGEASPVAAGAVSGAGVGAGAGAGAGAVAPPHVPPASPASSAPSLPKAPEALLDNIQMPEARTTEELRKIFKLYDSDGDGFISLRDLTVGLHARYVRKFARDVAARRKGAERGAVQLAVDASRQFFDHAALAKDDKMSFAHFARWRRLAPPVSVYCPVGLLEPPTASPAAGLAPIQEHHSSDIMCTLAPLLLHFVPGATLVARARNAFKSMDKGTGMLSHDDLVQGLSKFLERAVQLTPHSDEVVVYDFASLMAKQAFQDAHLEPKRDRMTRRHFESWCVTRLSEQTGVSP